MNKILIIGQAPPIAIQTVPYDTTLLYDWLNQIGISKEKAQDIFEFEAVAPTFRGKDKKGGHLKPLKSEMDEHWNMCLMHKVYSATKIILLGNVAQEYFKSKNVPMTNLKVYNIIHPSKRNLHRFRQSKLAILSNLMDATDTYTTI